MTEGDDIITKYNQENDAQTKLEYEQRETVKNKIKIQELNTRTRQKK